ncbi:UNVERIFIED_CONTAM: hypothetical protein Slati_4259300 [Sesamum latifolium]|uniref:Uncharacterized protein n=1 Tax=Sesamum latifolium TaxID=2727402 RepID=A0AAW2TC31_9LAMI
MSGFIMTGSAVESRAGARAGALSLKAGSRTGVLAAPKVGSIDGTAGPSAVGR